MTTLAEPGPEQVPRSKSLYDRDVYSWTLQQSQALRRRDLKAIDWENVIDEIESLGRGLQHAWEDYCARVIELFLKIEHWDDSSSARDPQHWAAAAQGCRLEMGTLVDENPGLESRYAAMFAEAWESGRKNAVRKLAGYGVISTPHAAYASAENKWDGVLPRKCPYRFADVTGFAFRSNGEPREDIWPPSVARVLNCDFRAAYPVRRARAKREARRQYQTPQTQPAPASSNPRQDSRTSKLYDRDCCAWSAQQAEALQRRDADAIDWDNVSAEIASLGRAEKGRWKDHCARAVEHLLVIEHCRQAAAKTLLHWMHAVLDCRHEMEQLIDDSPSLKQQRPAMFAEAWQDGRNCAADKLAAYRQGGGAAGKADAPLPDVCPYRIEHVIGSGLQSDRELDCGAWPPAAAKILNARLGEEPADPPN